MTFQDHFFGGGFEYWYLGIRFAISNAGTIYVVLVVFSPYKMLYTHLSVQQCSFISKVYW